MDVNLEEIKQENLQAIRDAMPVAAIMPLESGNVSPKQALPPLQLDALQHAGTNAKSRGLLNSSFDATPEPINQTEIKKQTRKPITEEELAKQVER